MNTDYRLRMIDNFDNNISNFVRAHKNMRIQNLSSKINKQALKEIHGTVDGRKALGIDGVNKADYNRCLDNNLDSLVDRLKRDSYNPKPSRRVYIPKTKHKKRPLGISCYEDKLVESCIAKLLTAVYEPKFMESSYGFRPNMSCHNAIKALRTNIMTQKVRYVVEADIKSFFDTIDHEWMIRFLEHDIADKKLLRLIKKFLKAGIMEEGKYVKREEGTPQGNVMSPVLANVYLHYVLDLWFEKVVKKHCRGEAFIVRYADDFVCSFNYKEDAENFILDLESRLNKFGLEVEKSKTKLLIFGRLAKMMREERGEGKPETFNFLGFTFCCGKAKCEDKFCVTLKTERRRLAEKLKKLKNWLYANRTLEISEIMKRVNKSLIGHYNYYGVPTNIRSINIFRYRVEEMIFKILNKRSQRKSYNWETFRNKVLAKFPLARPRIYTYV